MNLLNTENHKTVKGESLNILTGVLYLAPANLSGWEVCPKRSQGCTISCLYTAGRGRMANVQNARIKKTEMFFTRRDEFLDTLRKDIKSLVKKARKKEMTPAIRLNGTSDIEWTRFGIMEEFSDVQFYDYTKVINRLTKPLPQNYHLTFSGSEDNEEDCKTALAAGFNVAIVFKNTLPESYMEHPVYDGDQHDVRFLDPKHHVIGLKAKGKAKKDESGFVKNI